MNFNLCTNHSLDLLAKTALLEMTKDSDLACHKTKNKNVTYKHILKHGSWSQNTLPKKGHWHMLWQNAMICRHRTIMISTVREIKHDTFSKTQISD